MSDRKYNTSTRSRRSEVHKCTGVRSTSVVLFVLSLALIPPALAMASGSEETEEEIFRGLMDVTSMPRFSASLGRPAPWLSCSDRGVLAAPTHETAVGSAASEEVLRLMEVIYEKRCGIEDERETALQSVGKAHQGNLQAIAPKDMFESEAEYHARDAKEKSDVVFHVKPRVDSQIISERGAKGFPRCPHIGASLHGKKMVRITRGRG